MNATEFDALAEKHDPHESPLDRMAPPTLDEWTAAFAVLKARQRVGLPTPDFWAQFGLSQQNDAFGLQQAQINAAQQYGLNVPRTARQVLHDAERAAQLRAMLGLQ